MKSLVLAIMMLWTVGVFAVSASFAKDDSVITAQITNKIANDDSLKGAQIAITTEQAVVKVTGQVENDQQANAIVQIVQSVSGVEGFDLEHLIIKKSENFNSDDIVTSSVMGVFKREGINAQVSTQKGIVTLTGSVPKQKDADRAVSVAKDVEGVKAVHSNLKVEQWP